MVKTCFAYTGTEVVGMTFGETPNPRKNIPRAVKQTFYRIVVFYILSVIVLGMCVPYNDPELLAATKKSTSGGMISRSTQLSQQRLIYLYSCFSFRCCL
jgi:amino acid transporter